MRTLLGCLLTMLLVSGCVSGPNMIAADARKPIDRKLVEYPAGFVLKTAATGLTAPSGFAIVRDEGDYKGAIIIAESGENGNDPRIYGFKADGSYFSIYPHGRQIPFVTGLISHGPKIYGPIGGIAVGNGKIYVTHRDARGRGIVSAFGFDGSCTTLQGNLPAEGDYGMTDIAVHPTSGRVYFGVGAATNAGIVGLDNWLVGWVQDHPSFCDLFPRNLKLLGFKFLDKNPNAGFFSGEDNVETGPYQPFGKNSALRIPKSDRPTSAIYSISATGGDLRLEAYGIRYPRGLAFFSEYPTLFATNEGMELRGSRPVRDDPDVLLKIINDTWYGFPNYSSDLNPISDSTYQPDSATMSSKSYPENSAVIDQAASNLPDPAGYRDTVLYGRFLPLAGAAKLDFAPSTGSFRDYRGNAIVALAGDRAPFATSGHKLAIQSGYKVVRVDIDSKRVEDFIRNTETLPASKLGHHVEALERPVDCKFGPDGKLYILDYGKMEMRDGKERISAGTGKIFVLEPLPETAK